MSARAMRKMQGDALLIGESKSVDDDDGDEDESSNDDDDESDAQPAARSAFAFLPSDSSSDDDDDEEEEEANEKVEKEESPSSVIPQQQQAQEEVEAKDDEDLDAILDEFKEQDDLNAEKQEKDSEARSTNKACQSSDSFRILLRDLDYRELDLDWTMRNTLTAVDSEDSNPPPKTARRNNNRIFLFGNPPSRQHRPANFVGGGMGMITYDNNEKEELSIPWPFNTTAATTASPSNWYRILLADGYQRDLEDFEYVKQTGDLNVLLLFVAHHPFVTDALLQVAKSLNQAQQSQQATAFLKRCLWVYESTALIRFQAPSSYRFMDINVPENRTFFDALQQLVVVAGIAGLWRTCLAVSRYTLALDPLRDSLCLLAVLDSYALLCRSNSVDQWLVDLVERGVLQIHHHEMEHQQQKEEENGEENDVGTNAGGLLDLPNWAFSYPLALFRIHGRNERSDQHLRSALLQFPIVLGLLLESAEVDTTGRALKRDWLSLLDKVHLHKTSVAVDKLVAVYTKLGGKVWGDDAVLQFLYENAKTVLNSDKKPPPLHPSIERYARLRPSEWETRVQQLPEEANLVDPGLVAQAAQIETNRPRLLRRDRGQQQQQFLQQMNDGRAQGQPRFAGPPTGLIDPDLPLVELFWRSFLPWNHVDGVQGGGNEGGDQ